MGKRQTTRWHFKRVYRNSTSKVPKELFVGVIHNPDLRSVNHIRDVIRIKSKWVEGNDIDWAIRPDEAMDLLHGLSCALVDVMDTEEIARQKAERGRS